MKYKATLKEWLFCICGLRFEIAIHINNYNLLIISVFIFYLCEGVNVWLVDEC